MGKKPMRHLIDSSDDPAFAALLRNALALHRRQQIWESWLSASASGQTHLIDWREQVLSVAASNGTWAQWLRFRQADLIEQWNQHFPKEPVSSLKCRIQPGLTTLLKK